MKEQGYYDDSEYRLDKHNALPKKKIIESQNVQKKNKKVRSTSPIGTVKA